MYQALLLSDADVAVLRAAMNDPRFSTLTTQVPGLRLALQHLQPEFNRNLMGWVYDALREVRANTNYPEDWDYLSETLDEAWERRLGFEKAQEQAAEAGVPAQPSLPAETEHPAPTPEYFCIVHERVGSGDPFELGDVVYEDFNQAFEILKAFAEEKMRRGFYEDYAIATYAEIKANPRQYEDRDVLAVSKNDDKRTAFINHCYGGGDGSVRNCYFLQKFTQAGVSK
jgi:hypothetical protein